MNDVENQIHRIVNDKLESVEKDVAQTQKDVAKLSVKVDAMYGNGSGRKGILDRMQDSMSDSEEKNAKFRHDMRNTLQHITDRQVTQDTVESIVSKHLAKKNRVVGAWARWALGGTAGAAFLIGWELFKHYVLRID